MRTLRDNDAAGYPDGVSSDDLHRRREGDELGYVPSTGDCIRYAMRHSAWDENGHRLEDWPARDARGPWGPATDVVSVTPVAEPLIVKVACRNPRNGERTWIDLDWWICEPVYQDGALW
ncbi:hypothetical protein AB2L57_18200 (plasmid) [Microbacterium sp. HA-8]|uniref:hypothetical protein n=1 Tax=Microbacterium sp. HA-8 TaxID=3234200 RepID=UPI0038F7E3E5